MMGLRMAYPVEPDHETEPILALRAWRMGRNEAGELRIGPTTPRPYWEPGVAQVATCSGAHTREYLVYNPELVKFHRSPEPGCTCGYYAIKDPGRLGRSGKSVTVTGQVAMWGRVIEHSQGWRAQYVYPARLRLVCPYCLWLGRLPAEPDRVLTTEDRLRPVCAEHATRPTALGDPVPVERIQNELLSTYQVDLLPLEALLPTPGARSGDLITRILRSLDRPRT